MIDTHLRILPSVDDGLETLQESIRATVAPLHYNDEFARSSAVEVQRRVSKYD